METVVQTPSGERIRVQHPEGATDAEILNYAKQNYRAPTAPKPDTTSDVLRSIAAAPRKVAEGLIGLPGTLNQLTGMAMDKMTGQPLGTSDQQRKQVLGGYPDLTAPTPQDIQDQTKKLFGASYQPQTTPGRYAGSATEGAVGALLGPGGVTGNVLTGIASGLGSEAGREYLPNHPIIGGLVGGILGGAAATAAGKGIEVARNHFAAKSAAGNIGDILNTTPPTAGAVKRVAASAEHDALTLPKAKAIQDALGTEDAMVMDLGRQLQGRAEQMALHPGAAQNTVLNAVEGRTGEFGAGIAKRVRETLDTHLGESENIVKLINKIDDTVRQQADPAYKQVMSQYPLVQVPRDIIKRPAVESAMEQASGIAANYGKHVIPYDINKVGPNGYISDLEFWDHVKKGIDRRINTMMRTGMDDLSSAQKADLGGLNDARKALVSHLDTVTNGEYANARAIAATKPELHEALDFGRSIFNSKLLPEEVEAHIADLSKPAQVAAQVGARRELERVLDSVRNDGAKARNFLDTNNNIQKIESLFGVDAARAIENRVAAENTFQNATEQIARNSRTALRTELARDTADPSAVNFNQTAFGTLVGAPVKTGLSYMLQHGMGKTRSGMADILTTKGDELPLVVQQLMKYNAKRAANQTAPLGRSASTIARALMAQGVAR